MKSKIIIGILSFIAICVIVVLIVSLGSKNEYSLGETFVLKKNTQISIKNTDLKISLVSVGDSRCKDGWQCIWEGEIEYNIRVNNDTISLGTVRQTYVEYKEYRFVLDDDNDSVKYARIKVVKK